MSTLRQFSKIRVSGAVSQKGLVNEMVFSRASSVKQNRRDAYVYQDVFDG